MRRGPRGARALSALLLLVAFSLPTATLAGGDGSYSAAPCVGAGLNPPAVAVDPDCLLSGESNSDVQVSAVAEQLDVRVSWTYAGNAGQVDAFVVYKGPTPLTMHPIAVVEPDEPWEYVDEWGLVTGQSFWYSVHVWLKSGETIESDASLVRLNTV